MDARARDVSRRQDLGQTRHKHHWPGALKLFPETDLVKRRMRMFAQRNGQASVYRIIVADASLAAGRNRSGNWTYPLFGVEPACKLLR
jgi:hypothetical protein